MKKIDTFTIILVVFVVVFTIGVSLILREVSCDCGKYSTFSFGYYPIWEGDKNCDRACYRIE